MHTSPMRLRTIYTFGEKKKFKRRQKVTASLHKNLFHSFTLFQTFVQYEFINFDEVLQIDWFHENVCI